MQIGPTRTLDECYRRRLSVESALRHACAERMGRPVAQIGSGRAAGAYDVAYREHVNRTWKSARRGRGSGALLSSSAAWGWLPRQSRLPAGRFESTSRSGRGACWARSLSA